MVTFGMQGLENSARKAIPVPDRITVARCNPSGITSRRSRALDTVRPINVKLLALGRMRTRLTLLTIPLLVLFSGLPAHARIPFRRVTRSSHKSSAQSLRKRLHVNSVITDPGTMEVEWSNVYSTSGTYFMPTTLKLTPSASSGFWGQTELSLNFDSVVTSSQDGSRSTAFSDHLTFVATTVISGNEKWNFAVAPIASFFRQGDRGARLGAATIGRYDWGANSGGVSLAWTGATSSSPSNPAGTFDLGGGYGRKLATVGILSRMTPYANVVFEKSTGGFHGLSAFLGLEYQLNNKLALDASGQRLSLYGGGIDYQFAVGVTANLGLTRRWFGNR